MTEPTGNAPDVRTAILDLVPPYWGKPRIASFLLAFLDRVQELENAIDDVRTKHTIAGADLTRLKRLGAIVGESYADQGLEIYRRLVRARVRANRSLGTSLDLAEVLRLIFPDGTWRLLDGVKSHVVYLLSPVDPEPSLASGASRLLNDARSAGVALSVVVLPSAAPLVLSGPVVNVSTLTWSAAVAPAFPLSYSV